jgi:hypothetical protein
MTADLAIIQVLKNDLDIEVFPLERPQTYPTPCVVIELTEVFPSDTKSGKSLLDVCFVSAYIYGSSYKEVVDYSIQVRGILDRKSATVKGIEVQSIRYEGDDAFTVEVRNALQFVREQRYKVRIKTSETWYT